ncbi:MAG TPA: DUF2339 domain-containing protein [Candidatus Koribacter sp.]
MSNARDLDATKLRWLYWRGTALHFLQEIRERPFYYRGQKSPNLTMLEIIALVVALFCLIESSDVWAGFFVLVALSAAAWRAYKWREKTVRMEAEIETLRGDVQRITTLAERAVRIAAETANEFGALKRQGVTPSTAQTPETAAVEKPTMVTPEPVTSKPVDVTPRVEAIAAWSASVKTPPPMAPKVQEPPKPVAPTPPVTPPTPPAVVPPTPPKAVPASPVLTRRDLLPIPPPVFASAPPRKPVGERVRTSLALEQMLGTNWLSKIGVILLVIGIAGWGVTYFWNYGPLAKVALSTAIALVMLLGGVFLERKPNYRILGRTGIGGGWALLFFVSYALNHVAMMRLIDSQVVDAVVMLFVAGAMGAHTLRYRSQLVTGFAFLLAYSTIALSHDTVYSLVAGVILALAVVAIVVKLRWFELEVFAIVSSYGNHFYWLWRLLGEHGATGQVFPEFMASSSLLVFYWAAFRTSYVIRKVENAAQERLSTAAAILNTVLLLLVMKFQSAHPQWAFYALLILGALEFAIGQLPVTKRRRDAFVVLTIIGTALMLTAVPFKYAGSNTSILWLMGGEMLLFAGIFTGEALFRRLGSLTGLAVLGNVLVQELPRMLEARRFHTETPLVSNGILLLVIAAVFYANNTLLRKRWPLMFAPRFDDGMLTASSYPGAVTLTLGCWAMFVGDWQAVAFAAAVLTVAVLGWVIKSRHLQAQYLVIAAFACWRCLVYNAHWNLPGHITSRIVSLAAVAALFYVTAKFAQHRDELEQRFVRGIFAWAGTATAALLMFCEVPGVWQALAFALFAWGLIEAAKVTRYRALQWHTHLVALTSFGLAVMSEVGSTPMWHGVHVGIWKVLPVIAVFYLLAYRASRVHVEAAEWVRTGYTWAATILGLWLIYLSVDLRYVAAAWVVYAVALMAVSRWTRWSTLAWQAFAIGILSACEAGFLNLFQSSPNVHDMVRLVVCLIVIASLYAMAELLELPARIAPIHAWMASGLAVGLMWYELTPVAIAVGWALLGLVLYEYGAFRKVSHWRWQAYITLAGSFTRIFFANLGTREVGGWLSTRTVTVLPMVAIYYYVYLRGSREAKAGRRFDPTILFAYFGTAAVMALLYFEIANEWVVVAWAASVIALLAIAVLAKQTVFAQQAVLMSVAVLTRGMFHNLFGGSYFSGNDWSGRFGVMSCAIFLLLAALPLGFENRRRTPLPAGIAGWRLLVRRLERHAEQPIFFVAVALLTTMLALKMDHAMVTLSWGVEAAAIFIGALIVKERSFRLTGLGLLLVCVAKIVIVDLWKFSVVDRYLTLIVVGALLVAVSFLYSRYSERIRQYL